MNFSPPSLSLRFYKPLKFKLLLRLGIKINKILFLKLCLGFNLNQTIFFIKKGGVPKMRLAEHEQRETSKKLVNHLRSEGTKADHAYLF